MTLKKLLSLTMFGFSLGALTLTSNSFAQTALDRDDWSVSANLNSRSASNAIDGNNRSRWDTGQPQRDGQRFEIDFNRSNTFNQIVLNTSRSANDYPREYEIRVSNNGRRFRTIATGRPSASGITTINFASQTARYVRIEQNGRDRRFFWSIHELNIFSDGNSNNNNDSSSSNLPDGVHPDITRIANIPAREITRAPRPGYVDSYSVGDRCYCQTTFDHDIGTIRVSTPEGRMTVRQVCELLGPGPGSRNRPLYNDIQCGNGPANDQADEQFCPGRVDIGRAGCTHIGPRWNFN